MSEAFRFEFLTSALVWRAAKTKEARPDKCSEVEAHRFARVPLHVVLHSFLLNEPFERASRFYFKFLLTLCVD